MVSFRSLVSNHQIEYNINGSHLLMRTARARFEVGMYVAPWECAAFPGGKDASLKRSAVGVASFEF